MAPIIKLYQLLFKVKKNQSASIAIKRLNELIEKIPDIQNIENIKASIISHLETNHGIDKNQVYFNIAEQSFTIMLAKK